MLVTGTKIKPPDLSKKPHPKVKIEVTPDQEMESADEGSTNESPEASDESAASSDHSDHEHAEEEKDEQDKTEKEEEREEQDQVDRYRALQKNPYAGHLENQRISRLTQVQADIVEDSGKRFFFHPFGSLISCDMGCLPSMRDTSICYYAIIPPPANNLFFTTSRRATVDHHSTPAARTTTFRIKQQAGQIRHPSTRHHSCPQASPSVPVQISGRSEKV